MPAATPPQSCRVRVCAALADVPASAWDACANPSGMAYNPFISHAFLNACETSGSVGAKAGWQSAHVLAEDASGALVACAPAYLKSHSQGEYVFDHGFAEALERAGGRYYPKLQVSAPFTPVTGRRLLTRPGPQEETDRAALIGGLRALRQKTGASSIHITFPQKDEWEALTEAGFLPRTGEQFHFFNEGYADFEAFLGALASRKRKAIRRERKAALEGNGITIEWVTGSDLTEAHWDAFFAFYMDTGSRKWGRPYLTRKFFSLVGASMADHILLVMAKRSGRYIAGALNFIGGEALYGRNWGAIEEHPFLHFEVCYYQAIDFAIARGLKRVEAGAQGEHKLARGYRAVPTYSAHEFANPGLSRAVAEYLARERAAIAADIAAYGELAPFRRG
jgi:uncharacterized protein